MNQEIKQQEAAVQMLKMLVQAGRARKERLEAAEEVLNQMKKASSLSEKPFKDASFDPSKNVLARLKPQKFTVSEDTDYANKQADLSERANRLRKEQADLSNLLHKVPVEQSCEELTVRILAMQDEIEGIWDQKKMLERNREKGYEPVVDETGTFAPVAVATVEEVQEKAVLTVQLQRLREKQSKLRKKLENLAAKPSKRAEWATELAQVGAEIDRLTEKRYLL